MTNRELLETYRNAGMEMRALEEVIHQLTALEGVHQLPVSRACREHEHRLRMETVDGLEKELRAKWQELAGLQQRFEQLLTRFQATEDRVLLRSYYVLGLSDEKTAEVMNLSRSSVIRRRHHCLQRLDPPGARAELPRA